MDTDPDPVSITRRAARDAALQRAPGSVAGTVATSIADAASDKWEPVAVALRDHYPTGGVDDAPMMCVECARSWPCPPRRRAEEALDG